MIPVLGLTGMGLMLRRPELRQTLWMLPATIGVVLIVHVVLIATYRFAMPILPYVFLFAAWCWYGSARRLDTCSFHPRRSRKDQSFAVKRSLRAGTRGT